MTNMIDLNTRRPVEQPITILVFLDLPEQEKKR